MEPLEFVQAYTDDLLCISKGSLDDHIEKLDEVLKQVSNAGLKVNAEKRGRLNVHCVGLYYSN